MKIVLVSLIFLVSIFTTSSQLLFGQYSISYIDAASNPLLNQDVHTCQNLNALNTARLIVVSNNADATTVTVTMPTGVNYVPGTISTVQQIGGLSISEANISNLSMPVFSLSPSDLNTGDEIVFSWGRDADCDAVANQMSGGTFKDVIAVSGTGGTVIEDDVNSNTYDLLVPSVSLFGQGPITTSVGSTVTREVTITNGGLGQLGEFEFYIADGTGTLTSQLTTPSGAVLAPSAVVADTMFYTISAATLLEFGDFDSFFENGEQIVLTRTYDVLSCTNDSYYAASWGCGTVCASTQDLPQQTNIDNLVPNLAVTMPTIDRDYCYQGDNAIDGGAAVIQTFLVTNTGSGDATNFTFNLFNNTPGRGTGFNYFSLEPWVVKDEMGNPLGLMSNPVSLSDGNFYSSACGVAIQPAHISQEAVGIVIPAGQSVTIEVPTYADNIDCWLNCQNRNTPWWFFNTSFSYQGPCAVNNYSQNRTHLGTSSHNFMTYTVEMPTDLSDQECFDLEMNYSRLFSHVKSSTEGYVHLIIDLTDTGLTYNGGPTLPYLGYNFPVTVQGDSLRIEMQTGVSSSPDQFNIPLCASCSAGGGALTINYGHEVRYDESCSALPLKKYCGSRTFQMHCPGICIEGGATPVDFSLERISLGLTDLDNNGVADNNTTANPADVKLHSAVNGDTILGTWDIEVFDNTVGPNAGLPFNHLYVEFDTKAVNETCAAQTPRDSWFTALPNAVATVFPVGGGTSTCLVSPVLNGGIATYDLTSCKANWEGGDMVRLEAEFIANAYYTKQGFSQYVADNEVYSSYLPNPTGVNPSPENKYTCDHYNDYLNILNIYNSPFFPSPQAINGCDNEIDVFLRTYINVQSGDVWFPNEYRNFFIYDKYVLDWPYQFPYRPGSAIFNGNAIPDAAVTQVGNQLIFSNLSQFYGSVGGNIVPPDEADSRKLSFKVDPSCEAIPGATYSASFHGEHIGNGTNIPATNLVAHISCVRSESSIATITYDGAIPFITGGGTTQSTTDTSCWDVILNNGSNTNDAPNTWFYLEGVQGALSNQTVEVGGVPITPNAIGLYELGTNVAPSSNTYTVCADVSDCDISMMNVITGSHCSFYPSDIASVNCADTMVLTNLPYTSEVQLALVQEPSTPLPLCIDQNVEAIISSAQSAFLDDPNIEFQLPAGIFLTGPVMVEYPLASGNWEAVTPSQTGSLLNISIESHSQLSNAGLPGTLDALNSNERAAAVQFPIGTDCEFLSGSGLVFQAFGSRPCGTPAINNGVRIRTQDLNVVGASQTYATDVVTILEGDPFLDDCSSKSVDIDLQFVGISSTQTTPNDTVFVTLDAGIEYIAGSFACCSSDPSTCLSFVSDTQNGAGQTVIALALPATPLDITTPVQTCLSYEIANSNDVDCGLIKAMSIEAVTSTMSVNCPSEPSGSCPSLKIITGQEAITFTTRKTSVSLINENYTCDAAGNSTYELEVGINDLELLAGQSLSVDFYCATSSGTPATFLHTDLVTGPLAAGNIQIVSGIIPSGFCNPANGIVAQISKTNNLNQAQCICADLSIASGPIVFTPAAPTIAVQNNVCPATVGSYSVISNCGAGTQLQWSSDGGLNWTTTIPTWVDGLSVVARCVSTSDGNCISNSSNQVTAGLVDCCPTKNCGGISVTRN